MILQRAILIGGGSSLRLGLSKGLWKKLEGEFTIGLNSNYHHFNSTVLAFSDQPFYKKNKENLSKLPLVVCKNHNEIIKGNHLNFIPLPMTNKYDNTLKKGVYSSILVGLFAITIAIYLKVNEIFILGFDWSLKTDKKDNEGKVLTHYYQEDKSLKHRGFYKTSFYDSNKPEKYFKVYLNEPVKIYNVSLNSHINCFPKIGYDEFFKRLETNPINYNQDEIRNFIREQLNKHRKK